VLLLAAAVGAIGVAAAYGGRSGDQKRALAIGLRSADVGRGWIVTSKPSPHLVDLGSAIGAASGGPAGAGLDACFSSSSLTTGEVQTGMKRGVSASSMSTFQQARTASTLVSLVMVMRPGSAITPGEWRAAFNREAIVNCLVAEFKTILAQEGLEVGVAGSSTRDFATGSPLSATFRVALRVGSSTVSKLIYLDFFAQANGRDLTETLLLSAAPPAGSFEHRVTGALTKRLARFASPIASVPTA